MAESIIIDRELKPVVLKQIDPNQFGFIPGSSTTFALISIFHHWLSTCDSPNADVRTVLLDFKKAFDFVDQNLLVEKLQLKTTKHKAQYIYPKRRFGVYYSIIRFYKYKTTNIDATVAVASIFVVLYL